MKSVSCFEVELWVTDDLLLPDELYHFVTQQIIQLKSLEQNRTN